MIEYSASEHDRRPIRALTGFFRRPLVDRSLMGFVLYRLRFPLILMVVLTFISTIGYMALERYDFLTAAFFTVITLSTVGYGEARSLDATGQIFTMAVIITSFAGLLYTATTLTNLFTSGDAITHLKQQRGRRMRSQLSDHVIVVGFGRVGQAVARGVRELGHPCLVLERSSAVESGVEEMGCVTYIGDATDEHDLIEAGIERAIALVAATEEDSTNLVITLTARAVQPNLRIVSRVNEADWQDRIVRAGANVAQSPYPSYGLSLAATAVSSSSVELHTLPALGLAMEEIAVETGSRFIGMSVAQISALLPNIVIMGIRRHKSFQRWHEVDSPIEPDDVVIALGPPEGVRDLAMLG
jgi:voltage-gated potassium channel